MKYERRQQPASWVDGTVLIIGLVRPSDISTPRTWTLKIKIHALKLERANNLQRPRHCTCGVERARELK
eukprot:2171746-Pyramimonas_sp.AAC.1